jgi:F1F0 ATPase subunit 2
MDEKRVSALWFFLPAQLVAGFAVGVLYFRILWWNVRSLAVGRRIATVIALTGARFVLVAAVLGLGGFEGALPLLATALGLLLARPVVTRQVREAAP